MQLTEQQMDDVLQGKTPIRALRRHHFYMELDKVFIKARNDSAFKKIDDNTHLSDLPDGRFISPHLLVLKLGSEMMVFHREEGYEDSLRATANYTRVMGTYFSPMNKGEKLVVKDQHMIHARLLRSYMHVFNPPIDYSDSLSTIIPLEDYERLKDDFDKAGVTHFDNLDTLDGYVKLTAPKLGTFEILELDGVYTLVIEESNTYGLQILLTNKNGRCVYNFISHNLSRAQELNIAELYEKVTNKPLSIELKRIISYAYIAAGNFKHAHTT